MIFMPLEQFKIVSVFSTKVFCIDVSINNILIINLAVCLMWFFCLYFTINKPKKNFEKKTLLFASANWQLIINFVYKFAIQILFSNLSKKGEKYFPFLLVVFIFLLINNLVGLVPYSFTITSHLVVTFFLALSIFLGINLISFLKYKFELLLIFIPANTTFFLALLLIPIEFISFVFKPISLGVRLFANMMAGHTLLKVILGFSWSLMLTKNFLSLLFVFPLLMIFLLIGLELGIAIVQACVFVILVCIYINDCTNI